MRKYRSSQRVAAIGDGGNDVSMIQAAHAGIGIDAHEGNLLLCFIAYFKEIVVNQAKKMWNLKY